MSEMFLSTMNSLQCVKQDPPPAYVEKKDLKEYIRKDTYSLGNNLRWATPIEWKWNWKGTKRKFVRFGKPILQYKENRYDKETWYDVMTDNYTLLARHVD